MLCLPPHRFRCRRHHSGDRTKPRLVEASRLPITFGAPWGDNMMTGTVGLLEALRRYKGLEAIVYL